jgi:hypothetical protein
VTQEFNTGSQSREFNDLHQRQHSELNTAAVVRVVVVLRCGRTSQSSNDQVEKLEGGELAEES